MRGRGQQRQFGALKKDSSRRAAAAANAATATGVAASLTSLGGGRGQGRTGASAGDEEDLG